MQKQNEQGRSMVEMLGSLAVMGVLSAGAIGGYSYAMNKHRTNELIYEATKQAQWAGTQKEASRLAAPTVTGGSFGGGTISSNTVAGLPDTQIGILLTDLNESVCESLIKSVEQNTNGVVKAVRDETGTGTVNCESHTASLIFNRDLSTGELQAGSNGSGSGSGNEEPSEPTLDCGEHGEQVGAVCDCDEGWTGDDCSVESTDPNTYENQECDTNADCGSHGTYFCKYTSVNCTTGHTAKGRCTKTSSIRGSGDGYVWSTTYMDWFSAENFCAANGKEMISFDDLDCPYTLAQYKSNGNWGYCCFDDSNSIDSRCGELATETVTADSESGSGSVNSDFSSGIQAIQAAGAPLIWYWTQSLTNDSCYAFYVSLYDGIVSGNYRNFNGYAYALCE